MDSRSKIPVHFTCLSSEKQLHNYRLPKIKPTKGKTEGPSIVSDCKTDLKFKSTVACS